MLAHVNGIDLYYEKTGTGRPLIMIHCNSMNHKIFDRAVKLLKTRFTVYCLDSRDHGKSSKVKTLHYEDMAEDVYQFITVLQLEKPFFYGFSDGGIVGLLFASAHPELLGAMVISGASLNPDSTKELPMKFFKLWSHIDRSDKMQIMMREPNITDTLLQSITIPVYVTAGSRDLIKEAHTRHIAETIPHATLQFFDGESHTSYIMHSRKIADYILQVLPEV